MYILICIFIYICTGSSQFSVDGIAPVCTTLYIYIYIYIYI